MRATPSSLVHGLVGRPDVPVGTCPVPGRSNATSVAPVRCPAPRRGRLAARRARRVRRARRARVPNWRPVVLVGESPLSGRRSRTIGCPSRPSTSRTIGCPSRPSTSRTIGRRALSVAVGGGCPSSGGHRRGQLAVVRRPSRSPLSRTAAARPLQCPPIVLLPVEISQTIGRRAPPVADAVVADNWPPRVRSAARLGLPVGSSPRNGCRALPVGVAVVADNWPPRVRSAARRHAVARRDVADNWPSCAACRGSRACACSAPLCPKWSAAYVRGGKPAQGAVLRQ